VRGSIFDVYLLMGFSAVGYVFRKLSVPAAPMLMAFVLGPEAERTVRQSMMLSNSSPLIFVERPISATILAATVGVVVFAVISRLRQRRKLAAEQQSQSSGSIRSKPVAKVARQPVRH